MPNGNELANVLRWPKGQEYQHEWYAGQQLPEEWWKTDFPYGEAERMGYQLSPEETKKFYERKKKEKEKTLSEELADILKRPEVKMLDPIQRANLIVQIGKAQAGLATQEQAREKHETEMLEIGRQTQMQERVQAILQSDRVPAQKVTALTMAGIPLADARDMVWGKRGAEGEAKTPSRGAGAVPSPEGRAPRVFPASRVSGYISAAETGEYSPAELIAALMGEGIGSEAAQTIASTITAKDLTPEQKIAKRTAELGEAEYYRTLAVKRERPEMFVPLEERKFGEEKRVAKVGEELENRKFELDLKETLSTLNLDWAKFGHTKDTDYETAKLAREKFLLDVKKHGFEVAKQKASDEQWWADFGLEDRESQELAIRETKKFALEIEKFGLEEAVKRHGMQMKAGELKLNIKKEENVMTKWEEKKKQWTKTFGAERADKMFDQKMRGLKYETDVEDADRKHKLNVEKFGEEKADSMRTYELDTLKEKRALKESLFDMGFKKEEFVEKAAQFWATLTETKEEREEKARQFDTTEERLREQDADVMDKFEQELKLEYERLDLEVKQFGLDTETEARVAKMALLNFGLDVKKYGLDEAIHKFEVADADKKWYWREKEWPLKEKEAQTKYKEVMHRITQDAKEFGLKEAIHKENMRQFDEKQKVEWKKLDGTPEAKIEIGGNFGVDLIGLGPELQDEVMGYIKSTYNPKTGKTFFPSVTYMKQINGFLFDTKDGKKKKEELGCNLTSTDYMKAVAKQSWPEEVKGWCIRTRYNENLWQGVCEAGAAEGVYILPEGATKPGLWEKITDWWPFGKQKEKPTSTGNLRKDAEGFITRHGMERDDPALRAFLISLGWADWQISDEGIGGK